MRIVVDATSTLLRSAGVKRYTSQWITHLRKCAAPGEEIGAFPFLDGLADWDGSDLERSVLSPFPTLWRVMALHAINCLGQRALEAALRGAEVFHASNQVHYAPSRACLTATVHDLTAFLMPELHTAGNVRADRTFAERILRRAQGLIAVSENTRADAIRLLGIAPERIVTIHSGVSPDYFDARPARRERPYLLFVGTIEPRKNLDTLLDAWRQLAPGLRAKHELVIAGPVGWAAQATLPRIRAEATYLGYVPEADLPGLVAGAAAFVYPSLYEGFGFPVVQAMAAGTPVITSNVSCLPEIAGDAALLVDPRSADEIAGAMTRVLESETLGADLARRGRERAQRYRWETCAQRSLEFFRSIAGT